MSKGYTILIGVISSAFLTRYLGLSYRGEYAFVVQVAAVSVLVFDMGLSQTYSFFYRKRHGQMLAASLRVYGRQFVAHLILAGVAVTALGGSSSYALAALLVPFGILRTRMESAMAVENIRLKVKVHMWSITISMVAYAMLYLLKDGAAVNILFPVVVTIAVHTASIAIYIRTSGAHALPSEHKRGFTGELVRFSWLPMLTIVLVTLNYSVDIVLLRYLGTEAHLSLYAVAASIAAYAWMIPDAFKEVLASRVARSSRLDPVNTAMRLSVGATIVLIITFATFGKPVLHLLYGRDFAGAYAVTLILFAGVISMVFYKMIGVLFLAEGRRRFYFITLASSVVLNVVLNVFAIPVWGMYGSAVASVASYSLCGGVFLMYYLRLNSVPLSETVFLRRGELPDLLARLGTK